MSHLKIAQRSDQRPACTCSQSSLIFLFSYSRWLSTLSHCKGWRLLCIVTYFLQHGRMLLYIKSWQHYKKYRSLEQFKVMYSMGSVAGQIPVEAGSVLNAHWTHRPHHKRYLCPGVQLTEVQMDLYDYATENWNHSSSKVGFVAGLFYYNVHLLCVCGFCRS